MNRVNSYILNEMMPGYSNNKKPLIGYCKVAYGDKMKVDININNLDKSRDTYLVYVVYKKDKYYSKFMGELNNTIENNTTVPNVEGVIVMSKEKNKPVLSGGLEEDANRIANIANTTENKAPSIIDKKIEATKKLKDLENIKEVIEEEKVSEKKEEVLEVIEDNEIAPVVDKEEKVEEIYNIEPEMENIVDAAQKIEVVEAEVINDNNPLGNENELMQEVKGLENVEKFEKVEKIEKLKNVEQFEEIEEFEEILENKECKKEEPIQKEKIFFQEGIKEVGGEQKEILEEYLEDIEENMSKYLEESEEYIEDIEEIEEIEDNEENKYFEKKGIQRLNIKDEKMVEDEKYIDNADLETEGYSKTTMDDLVCQGKVPWETFKNLDIHVSCKRNENILYKEEMGKGKIAIPNKNKKYTFIDCD